MKQQKADISASKEAADVGIGGRIGVDVLQVPECQRQYSFSKVGHTVALHVGIQPLNFLHDIN